MKSFESLSSKTLLDQVGLYPASIRQMAPPEHTSDKQPCYTCHSKWNIVHRPLVSMHISFVLPPPSSSSYRLSDYPKHVVRFPFFIESISRDFCDVHTHCGLCLILVQLAEVIVQPVKSCLSARVCV